VLAEARRVKEKMAGLSALPRPIVAGARMLELLGAMGQGHLDGMTELRALMKSAADAKK